MNIRDSSWQKSLLDFLDKAKKPLIVILGPTAGGKTAFSIQVAEYITNKCQNSTALNKTTEIINADSRQLYRHLSIGTAKVTKEEMSGVPHHMIDVLDPDEEATVGWYQLHANAIIRSIHERGGIPLLVGGSMLYVSSIIDNLTLAPSTNPQLRESLEKEYDADGGESLHARLAEIDPESAERIHRNNKPKLVRAVEIFELTNLPKSQVVSDSELQAGKRALKSAENNTDYDLLIFGIGKDRKEILERINARTDAMFEDGWIEEVQDLFKKGFTPDDPGMKSTGYREIIQFLQKGAPETEEELREQIAAKTRQYARRQMTWWKRDPRIVWIYTK